MRLNTLMDIPFSEMAWLLFITFFAAGAVKGVTGMGLPTLAMGILSTVLPPVTAAAILLIPSFVTNVWQLASGRNVGVLVRRLWPMMVTLVFATVAGLAFLVKADTVWSSLGLGIALIAYAAYALISPSLHVSSRIEPWLSPVVGVATGVVTGATGVFVMPAVPYLQALRLEKDDLIQALGLSFTISTVALAAGLAVYGSFRVDQLGLSSLAIVPALLGMWLGQKIRTRISPPAFRLLFLSFLLLLGMQLASRPFL